MILNLTIDIACAHHEAVSVALEAILDDLAPGSSYRNVVVERDVVSLDALDVSLAHVPGSVVCEFATYIDQRNQSGSRT